MIAPTQCPSCAGLSQPEHPAGVLSGWRHLQSCVVLHAEDATAAADSQRLDDRPRIVRTATSTELTLLASIGYTWPPADPPTTVVRAFTYGVRRRSWPDATPPATTEGA